MSGWTSADVMRQKAKVEKSQKALKQATGRTTLPQDARSADLPSRERSKYGAVKTTVDGLVFDSAKEARRYGELKLLEKAGEIHGLELQKPFDLTVSGDVLGRYVSDFCYVMADGLFVCEDVKGMKTPLYRWKAKHFMAQYGFKITEL